MSAHSYICIKEDNQDTLKCSLVNSGGYYDDIGEILENNYNTPELAEQVVDLGKCLALRPKIEDVRFFDKRFGTFKDNINSIQKLAKENYISMVLVYEKKHSQWFVFHYNEFDRQCYYLKLEDAIKIDKMLGEFSGEDENILGEKINSFITQSLASIEN